MMDNFILRQSRIAYVIDNFSLLLNKSLSLIKIQGPLIVSTSSGEQDNLTNCEKAVIVTPKHLTEKYEIVHSLAKWKRNILSINKFTPYNGIFVDMKAIRQDEELDPIHSICVDQWDWEFVIHELDRTIDFLKKIVNDIYKSIKTVESLLTTKYNIPVKLPNNVTFIESEELLNLYPTLCSKEREHEIVKKYGAVFIIGIGNKLSNGEYHDKRAVDYDDWSTSYTKNNCTYNGLNGDLLIWNSVLKTAVELSSMGIRVSPESYKKQLILSNQEAINSTWHNKLLNNELCVSIGGGIGKSRLVMCLLQESHIGNVHCGIWDNKTHEVYTELL